MSLRRSLITVSCGAQVRPVMCRATSGATTVDHAPHLSMECACVGTLPTGQEIGVTPRLLVTMVSVTD